MVRLQRYHQKTDRYKLHWEDKIMKESIKSVEEVLD